MIPLLSVVGRCFCVVVFWAFYFTLFSWIFLQHRLQVVGDLERRTGLGLDLLNRNTIGELDEGQALGRFDVKYALQYKESVFWLSYTHILTFGVVSLRM